MAPRRLVAAAAAWAAVMPPLWRLLVISSDWAVRRSIDRLIGGVAWRGLAEICSLIARAASFFNCRCWVRPLRLRARVHPPRPSVCVGIGCRAVSDAIERFDRSQHQGGVWDHATERSGTCQAAFLLVWPMRCRDAPTATQHKKRSHTHINTLQAANDCATDPSIDPRTPFHDPQATGQLLPFINRSIHSIETYRMR